MASVDTSPFRYYKGPLPLTLNITNAAIDAVKTFTYRDDDILIASYPKSGTHWLNEIIQLMLHEGDPQKLDVRHRRVSFEITDTIDITNPHGKKSCVELVNTDPSPRVLMTHLTPGYLSDETWQRKIPIVYIFRDPRDVCLSMNEFVRQFRVGEAGYLLKETTDFKQFLSDFIEGKVVYGGWCEHALSYEDYWKKGERILFVTYEDMKQDLPSVIKAIANHIGRQVSDEVVDAVVANSTLEAMRKNYSATKDKEDEGKVDLSKFVKKGISGKWKIGHSEDEWRELNEVFKQRVKDSEFAKKYFA